MIWTICPVLSPRLLGLSELVTTLLLDCPNKCLISVLYFYFYGFLLQYCLHSSNNVLLVSHAFHSLFDFLQHKFSILYMIIPISAAFAALISQLFLLLNLVSFCMCLMAFSPSSEFIFLAIFRVRKVDVSGFFAYSSCRAVQPTKKNHFSLNDQLLFFDDTKIMEIKNPSACILE